MGRHLYFFMLAMLAGGILLLNLYAFPSFIHRIETVTGQQFLIPDARPGYSVEEISRLFDNWGKEGRVIYRQMLLQVDLLYPLVYSFFFFLLLNFGVSSRYPSYRYWAYLPFLTAIFDYAENLSILHLLHTYPEIPEFWCRFASAMTIAKWLTLLLVFIALIILLVAYVLKQAAFFKN